MIAPAALVALACYAAPPSPIVSAEVYRALLGVPVAAAPTRADVAAALAAVAPMRRRRHGR